ncbi:hypothetical protein BD779DRAFT_1473069 [Infundibulicybe gibba]|nr:hypothetical protein BD779DRAFT_1473069 [Infundibulicybe gibba]
MTISPALASSAVVKLGEMSNDSRRVVALTGRYTPTEFYHISALNLVDDESAGGRHPGGNQAFKGLMSDCGGNKACAADQQHGAVSEREQAFLEQSLLTTQHELVCAFKRAVDIKSRILVLDPSFEFVDMIDDLRYQMSEREAALKDERARRREAEQVLADTKAFSYYQKYSESLFVIMSSYIVVATGHEPNSR